MTPKKSPFYSYKMANCQRQHLEWMVHGWSKRLICKYVLVQCIRMAQAQTTLFMGNNVGHSINKDTNTKIIEGFNVGAHYILTHNINYQRSTL